MAGTDSLEKVPGRESESSWSVQTERLEQQKEKARYPPCSLRNEDNSKCLLAAYLHLMSS